MNIKAFNEDKISSYKIAFEGKNIMLDFNGDNINKDDIIDIDFIFVWVNA